MDQELINNIKVDTQMYLKWLDGLDRQHEAAPDYPTWPRYHDNLHFPLGMKQLLSLGFSGIRDQALKNAKKFKGPKREYLLLVYEVYKKITEVTGLEGTPNSFAEACHLYWAATLLRIGTATIGRIDQHIFPYYEKDVKKGKINEVQARAIIGELLDKYEKRGKQKGDTLQNLTLSGRNVQGRDKTNLLSYLILELALEKNHLEPKINVRVHNQSPQRLLDLIAALQLAGTGNCTVFNDEIIIKGLMSYGRPAKVAADYCADGCSEIILDGYGETWFRYIDCVKAVEHVLFNGEENLPPKRPLQYYSQYQEPMEVSSPVSRGLKTGSFLKMRDFRDFYRAYLKQLQYQIRKVLKDPYSSNKYPMRLFTAATLPNVLRTAQEPYTSKDCYHTFGLFIGSLGTAVNSLAAIKSLIYEKKQITKKELVQALRGNFEGSPLVRQLCQGAPKYGNDDDYVDAIAADIAGKFASWVKKYRGPNGQPILPGLYNHLFHYTAYSVGPTPDGRRYGDPVGEHLSPTPGTAKLGPTAVINSLCKVNIAEQVFGSTLHLSLPRNILQGVDEPGSVLTSLLKTFIAQGGAVLNLSVLDAHQLREARLNPEKYEDLMVRVWGFSYYFTRLSREMQDHVIARFEGPCAD